jgi:hypothetical protein
MGVRDQGSGVRKSKGASRLCPGSQVSVCPPVPQVRPQVPSRLDSSRSATLPKELAARKTGGSTEQRSKGAGRRVDSGEFVALPRSIDGA